LYRAGGFQVTERSVRARLGPDKTEVYGDVTVRYSGEYEIMADLSLPTWLEVSTGGTDNPDQFARIELRNQRPEIVAMSWTSGPGQREIKPKDLRERRIAELLDLYRFYTMRVVKTEQNYLVEAARRGDTQALRTITDVEDIARPGDMQALRAPGHRVITDEFLASVADVYRRNIAHAPTQAVARTFGVKPRMASNYVDKARQAGHLPPTKQGKKQA
jgi:hypothetical protein